MVVSDRKPAITPQPEWWNDACKTAKQHKYALLRGFRLTTDSQDFETYQSARKYSRDVCQGKKLKMQLSNRRNLVIARINPRKF